MKGTQEIDPCRDGRWEEFVARCPQSSVFHSKPWLCALRKAYGYEPAALISESQGRQLANGIVFCRIKSRLTGKRVVSLPFSDHCEPLVEGPAERDELLARLRQMAMQDGWRYVEVRPCTPSALAEGFAPQKERYVLHRLRLAPGAAALFAGFNKSNIQRKIRRAEREGLKYEQGRGADFLREFYRLHVATRKRHCLPPQPFDWFRALAENLGERCSIRLARAGGKPAASVMMLAHKKTLTYKYGCSDGRSMHLGGTQLLFWRAIQDAVREGFEELDFGRTEAGNQGLLRFKDQWGASRSELTYWRFPSPRQRASSIWPDRARELAAPLCPEVVLKAIGNVLYRHLG